MALGDVLGHVQFQNVSFRYPGRPDMPVLDQFDPDVAPGRTTAVVGPSGSGKSTLVSLLERFYEPSAGRVCLDGQPLQSLDLQWLRRQIALVGQEAMLFDATVFENISHGLVGSRYEIEPEEVRREMVRRAAEIAHAHPFVSLLPDLYDTRVGERGAMLSGTWSSPGYLANADEWFSGGQKQRISIARAIVSDPKILLLDEATSALDPVAEQSVQAALRTAMRGRTNLVIAHRLSTIREADCIAVMGKGRVVEQGTYESLVEKRGHFFRLLEAQSLAVEDVGNVQEGNALHHVPTGTGSLDEKAATSCPGNAKTVAEVEPPSGALISALRTKDRPTLLAGLLLSILLGCTSTAQSVILSAVRLSCLLTTPISPLTGS